MRLDLLAEDQLRRAFHRQRDARTALRERRLAGATRYAQEALELALRAALRSLAVEVPKRHDVAPVLVDLKGPLPAWFARELPAVGKLSFDLAERRGLAMYGDEKTGRPASELFDRPEEVAGQLDAGGHALDLVERLTGRGPRRKRRS